MLMYISCRIYARRWNNLKYFNDGFFFHKRDVYRHIKKSVATAAAIVLCFQGVSAVPGLSALMEICGITDRVKLGAETVYAEQVIAKGQIPAGDTNVRIRTESNTNCDIITKKNGGFTFDILQVVKTSDTYDWYKIGFNHEGSYTTGYIFGEYVQVLNDYNYEENTDFEAYLNKQGFPESYKAGLRQIHAQYPKWNFVARKISVDWNTFINNENVNGRSLVSGSSISSWKSIDAGCYDWETDTYVAKDSGNWVQASKELVEYCADPRNYLNTTNIFAFESLAYDSNTHNESGVNNVISGSFMANSSHDLSYNNQVYNYASALIVAANQSGVSPYHLATRILQEQGINGTGNSISGNVSGLTGLYNYYNIGAYKSGNLSAVEVGLKYAALEDSTTLRPWNTRMRALIGGAIFVGKAYINIGQNTIYYEKFDVFSGSYYHQYMTNIQAAFSESAKAATAYTEEFKRDNAITFYIPVFNNMPSAACSKPTGDGNPNNYLAGLSVNGISLTPSFNMYNSEYGAVVASSVSSVTVAATAVSDKASVSGTGTYNLKYGTNVINIKVTAQNGKVRNYTVNIARPNSQGGGDANMNTEYAVDSENGIISGIASGISPSEITGKIAVTNGCYVRITDMNGNTKSDICATGDLVNIYNSSNVKVSSYTVSVEGDVNGDGSVDILDIVKIKNDMLGKGELSGAYKRAADIDNNGTLDIIDIVKTKNMILND